MNVAYMKYANFCVHSIKTIEEYLSGAFHFLLGIVCVSSFIKKG